MTTFFLVFVAVLTANVVFTMGLWFGEGILEGVREIRAKRHWHNRHARNGATIPDEEIDWV